MGQRQMVAGSAFRGTRRVLALWGCTSVPFFKAA
jgi:hypothetical protein